MKLQILLAGDTESKREQNNVHLGGQLFQTSPTY